MTVDEALDAVDARDRLPPTDAASVLAAEVRRLRAENAWFIEREPLVRAFAGAYEDCTSSQVNGEWQQLVDWEVEHPNSSDALRSA
jgi:hypothetical protein